MIEFGTIRGLAQSGQYDQKINDLRYNEQADKRAKNEAEARAKLFADDMDYNNALNEHDAPLVKQFAQSKIKEIGRYLSENPDAKYNPEKLAYVKSLQRELKSNTDLNRGLASDNERKKWLADYGEVAKNPNFYDVEAYKDIENQWNNYKMFGNQDGEEAAKKEGKKSFTYSKPRDFIDLVPSLQKIGNQSKNGDVIKPKNGNIGEWYTKMNDQQLEALTDAAIQQNARQIESHTNKMGITDPQQKRQWVKSQIESGFDKEYHIGDANAAWERGMKEREFNQRERLAAGKKEPLYSSAWDEIFSHNAGSVNPSDIDKIWGNTPVSPIVGYDGTKVDLSNKKIDWRGGRFVKRNGVPFFLGDIRISPEEARQKGIINVDDEDDLKEMNISDNGMRIAAGFTGDKVGKAKFEKGTKNGKPTLDVVVSYEMPIKLDDPSRRIKLDALMLPGKYVEPIRNERQQPTEKQQGGTYYTIGGKQYESGSILRDKKTGKAYAVPQLKL
mgnify:FL=1